MENFRLFLESNESDAHASIRKLPAKYRKLVRGYTIKFQNTGTLKGDDGHIGRVQDSPTKSITIAAPWFYSRNFVLLHEIGHLVWSKYVKGTPIEKKWITIAKNTKTNESIEELFAHGFAAQYVKYPPTIFYHKTWRNFFDKLSKIV